MATGQEARIAQCAMMTCVSFHGRTWLCTWPQEAWYLHMATGQGGAYSEVCIDGLRVFCRSTLALRMATRGGFKDRQGGALCTSSNVSRRAGTHGLGAAHHPPLLWPAGRAPQTGHWCMCIVRSRIQRALVLSTQLRQRYKSWLFRGVRHQQTDCPSSPPVKKEDHSLYVCAIVVVPFLH